MEPERAVINQWTNAAPYWEKHRDTVRQMFAPVTKGLVEDARIVRGHTVLDIAMGPGEPALSVATLVGPEGKVIGTDPIPEMVEAARREAGRLALANAQFEVASAGDLPFPADTFDAVICRFGAMFFPSPVDAVREILRVLKPGGRLALAVWYLADTNPFFYTLQRVIDRYVETPPPVPDAPEAFRFAVPGKLRDMLEQAGVAAASERLLQFPIEASGSAEEFYTLRCELSEKLREKVGALSEEQRAEVKRLSLDALREFSTSCGMSFPAEVLIVSGAKP